MKFFAIILFFKTIFCFSQINNEHLLIKNFICLDSLDSQKLMKDYKLTLPEDWCTYKGFHDIPSHSPKHLDNLSETFRRNQISVYYPQIESFQSKNIEEALEEHVISYNYGTDYDRTFTPDMHKVYGKYYVVTYKSIQNGDNLIILELIFNHKNQDYILSYSVLEKDYEIYINEALDIMSTFKIK